MTSAHDPFGLLAFFAWNHHWNKFHFDEKTLLKAVKQLSAINLSFVRMDILWTDVQHGDFNRYDPIIDLLKDHNIQVLPVLGYNKDHKKWNTPPQSFDEFASFVKKTVAHFKTRVQHWEIWNEPNHPVYWSGPKDGLYHYSSLLKKSYQAAKDASPDCLVLNGGLSEPILEDISNLYEKGGKDYFDILNFHPFINPLIKDPGSTFTQLIKQATEIMKKYGDYKKKIWITEMGCPGIPQNGPATWFAGKSTTEEEQASWIRTQYALAKKFPEIEKVFWAFYRDTDKEFLDGTDYLGLVRGDLSPKPAFQVFKQLIAEQHQ